MRRTLALIISGVVFTAPVIAMDKYAHCFEDNSTEICKAFMAGMEVEKSGEVVTEKASLSPTSFDKDSLLGRALEQRAGERVRTSVLTKKG
ncbi:hypothetical protein [Enterovibrio coralii]|uniref:Uncharacterized protein n=1 Tax=Enterovibrio coralii TaxID=294935 RepID=A0A135I2L6_9GAMM|nr:hypothetical protein [Enterovibrio coralii]KXF79664.1 hypothetical protein ATN88_15440 [Enterovibrio coralii]